MMRVRFNVRGTSYTDLEIRAAAVLQAFAAGGLEVDYTVEAEPDGESSLILGDRSISWIGHVTATVSEKVREVVPEPIPASARSSSRAPRRRTT